MEFGLIPETVEEFERQFGRERVAACATGCHLLLRGSQDRLSDADRRELFRCLIETDWPDTETAPVPALEPAAAPDESGNRHEDETARDPAEAWPDPHRTRDDRLQRLEREYFRLQQSLQLTELRAQQAENERDVAESELRQIAGPLEEERRLRRQAETTLESANARLASSEKRTSVAEHARAASEERSARLAEESREQRSKLTELRRTLRRLEPAELMRFQRRLSRVEEVRDEARESAAEAQRKLTDLRREARELRSKHATADRARSQLQRKLDNALARIRELEAELAVARGSGLALFNDMRVRAWAAKQARTRSRWIPPSEVVVSGFGPLPTEALSALLAGRGVQVAEIGDADVAVMIVGREGWLVDDLEDQIKARAGQELFIYSQEMVLTALLVGVDPFDTADTKTLLEFATGHEALRCCIDEGFMWPSIPTATVVKRLTPPPPVQESPIHKMGYRVGRTDGVPERERREILERAFRGKIPFVESRAYMSHWGQPDTRRRLRCMARLISWHIAGARGRSRISDMSVAIDEWSSDLDWMHEELYESWMRFRWPGTRVEGASTGRRRRGHS